jgi:predicted amidohydrolase
MVVDPLGALLYHKTGTEDIATVTIEKPALELVRQQFPFWKDADHFMILEESVD